METLNCNRWSGLPVDILRYLLERLSFFDFHRAKMVCSDWYLCSKQALRPKGGSPLLLLSLEEGGIGLYNPNEDRVYKTKRDFSGYRFLGNSGKWFLVLDSLSDLYIIDVFSEERIRLPPLESIKGGLFWIERVDDKEFKAGLVKGIQGLINQTGVIHLTAKDLSGLLWVDDKNGDYVVVWKFDNTDYLGFCKKGDVHYRKFTTSGLQQLMVLKGYSLYVFMNNYYILHLDFSRQDGFKVVSVNQFPMRMPLLSTDERERFRIKRFITHSKTIAVTTSGEILFIYTGAYESTTFERHKIFLYVYKSDSETYKTKLVDYEVCSLSDEALFLDLGITVPANHTLGIEPNSIYLTDPIPHTKLPCLDICVHNLATKTIKRFPSLSNLKLKDAQWFLPS